MRIKTTTKVRQVIAMILAFLVFFQSGSFFSLLQAWAGTSSKSNWTVEYALSMDDGIPLADADGTTQVIAAAGESVNFEMLLMADKGLSKSRFKETFDIYIPDEIYDFITLDGQLFQDGWIDSEITECGYLLEQYNSDKASASNASASNADKHSDLASDSNFKNRVHKVSLRFVEELRKAETPLDVEIEDVSGIFTFTVPEDMILSVIQTGNDCRISMEKAPAINILRAANIANMPNFDISLKIKEDGGTYTDAVSWHPDYYKDKQVITLLIEYQFNGGEEAYPANSLKISIESLIAHLSEATRLGAAASSYEPAVVVSSMGWERDETSGNKDIITFTNSDEIDGSFNGHIILQWNINACLKQDDYVFQAVISDGVNEKASEECTLSMEKDKLSDLSVTKSYTLANTDEMKANIAKLPENYAEYYWVRYRIGYGTSNHAILFAQYEMYDAFPKDCLVLDKNFKEAVLNKNNEYTDRGTIRNNGGTLLTWSGDQEAVVYVGYPKDKYGLGDPITNTATLSARYEDTDEWVTKEASCALNLADFDFSYQGELYSFTKSGQQGDLTIYEARNRKPDETPYGYRSDGSNYWLESSATYSGEPMDIVIGDDLLYITRTDGTVSKLEDGEYQFTFIRIPTFYNDIGENYDGYDFTFEVRRSGNDFYEDYDLGINKLKIISHSFDRHDDIVAWRLTLKGIDGALKKNTIMTALDIFSEDAAAGSLYNFGYLQVYIDGVLRNPAKEANYSTFITKKEIAAYDLKTYGTYLQRGVYTRRITPATTPQFNLSKSNSQTRDEAGKKTNINYTVSLTSTLPDDAAKENDLETLSIYDILPPGVNLRSDNDISFTYFQPSGGTNVMVYRIVLKDGTVIDQKDNVEAYMKERTILNIQHNYEGTGRTKVTGTVDFTDNPVSLLETFPYIKAVTKSSTITWLRITIPSEITDEDVMLYGNVVKNHSYGEAISALDKGINYGTSVTDDGTSYDLAAKDINKNNDTTEKVLYASAQITINNLSSSIQSIKKFVGTSYAINYVTPYGKANLDEEYSYRLRVTTGENYLGNIVLYDTIENPDAGVITEGWQGTFLGVDTSYAESLGFAPVVWYSTELSPNSLVTHEAEWKEYDENMTPAEKAAIKTIAFDLRKGTDGQPKSMPPACALYVEIHMKTPAGLESDFAKNNFRSEWTLMTSADIPLDGEVKTLTSNTVRVDLDDHETPELDIELTKVDERDQPVTSDSAKFGVFYDAAATADPVIDDNGDNVQLITNGTGALASVSFKLDENKARNDGNDYYMLYLRETEIPNRYYGLGGTAANPSGSYIIKLKVVVADNGMITVIPIGENEAYSSLKATGNQIKIKAVNYKKPPAPLELSLEAQKILINPDGTRQTVLPGFKFEISLVKGDTGAVTIPAAIVQTETAGPIADICFKDIKFTAAGDYQFKIVELPGDDAAISYNTDSWVLVDVIVIEDNNYQLVVKDGVIKYSKDSKEGPESGNGSEPQFVNSSKIKTSGTIKAHKTLSGKVLADDEFSFIARLIKGTPMKSEGVSIRIDDIVTARNQSNGTVAFAAMEFYEEGSYVFEMTEVPNTAGRYVEYDESKYYAVVTVERISSVKLEVTSVQYYDEAAFDTDTLTPKAGRAPLDRVPEFFNYYDRSGNPAISIAAVKTYYGGNLAGRDFTFTAELTSVPDSANVIASTGVLKVGDTLTVANNAAGDIFFGKLRFDTEGTYQFKLTEETGTDPSIAYDKHEYLVEVIVTENTGILEAEAVYPNSEDKVIFTNILITESAKWHPELTKRLLTHTTQSELWLTEAYEFTLTLADGDADAVELPAATTVSSDLNGIIPFADITFNRPGTFTFEVAETAAANPAIISDSSVITIEVTITADADGKLTAATDTIRYNKPDKTANEDNQTFVNLRIDPVKADLLLTKTVYSSDGSPIETDLEAYEFTIALNRTKTTGNAETVTLPFHRMTNNPDGSINVNEIEFTESGVYIFDIQEVKKADHGTRVYYDSATIEAEITVTKGSDRKLNAAPPVYTKSQISDKSEDHQTFVNLILPDPVQPDYEPFKLEARKRLLGRTLNDGEFSFRAERIYTDTDVTVEPLTAVNNAAGKIAFTEQTLKTAGVYVFRISEIKGTDTGIRYDEKVCYAEVTIRLDDATKQYSTDVQYGTAYDSVNQKVSQMVEIPLFENETKSVINILKVSKSNGSALSGAVFEFSI